jgi:hypothetical protein
MDWEWHQLRRYDLHWLVHVHGNGNQTIWLAESKTGLGIWHDWHAAQAIMIWRKS